MNRSGEREPEACILGEKVWHFDNSQLTRELILKGEGWGALAEYQVRKEIRAGRLVKLPLTFSNGI